MNAIEQLKELCKEVWDSHKNPTDEAYNECEIDECLWCSESKAAITALQSMQGQAVGTVYVGEQDAYSHGRNFYWLTNPINIPDGTQLYTHPQSPAVVEGYTAVKTETLQWLLGESDDFICPEDQYFRGKPAPYFWRKQLRAAMLTASGKDNNHE
jgi:hypothetical protein